MEWVDLTKGGWSRTADCNVVRPSEHATGAFAEGDSEMIQRAYIGLSRLRVLADTPLPACRSYLKRIARECHRVYHNE
jgi:hypothetical protein